MTTTAPTGATPTPRAQVVFGIGAAVGLVVALADALAIRSALPPGFEPLAGDFRGAVWSSWVKDLVPLAILPALASAALWAAPGPTDVGRPWRARASIIGACAWLLGTVVVEWRWWPTSDWGWYNYAPNSGEVFSPDGTLARLDLAMVVAWAGLTVAAAALAPDAVRSIRGADDAPDAVTGWRRLLLVSQLVVLVIGPVVIARIVWQLATQPGRWGTL